MSVYSTHPSPPLTPFTTFDELYDPRSPPPDIIPPAMPTTAQTVRYITSSADQPRSVRRSMTAALEGRSDAYHQSSAADSLRRFHNSSTSTRDSVGMEPGRKASYHARCPSVPNLSSLSMTPSSPDSSSPTAGRFPSGARSPLTTTSVNPLGSSYTQTSHPLPEYSYYYSASTRPLPPRTPNSYSTSTPRSIDLVTPHTPYLPTAHTSGRATPKRQDGLRSVPGSFVDEKPLRGDETGMMFAFREMRGRG